MWLSPQGAPRQARPEHPAINLQRQDKASSGSSPSNRSRVCGSSGLDRPGWRRAGGGVSSHGGGSLSVTGEAGATACKGAISGGRGGGDGGAGGRGGLARRKMASTRAIQRLASWMASAGEGALRLASSPGAHKATSKSG
ncbi:MAG: hypothetical protein B7Z13_06740 [Caulobacterales bacterium 32-67-6]|nr:MAG: hypothetical protein B7Z13_06740 [Caulobacterales bacterium 32-67-6]